MWNGTQGQEKSKSAVISGPFLQGVDAAHATGEYAGRSIVILGMARQGMALARFLVSEGASVTLSDMANAEALGAVVDEANALGVSLALGGHPLSLLDGCDLLCLSGGVPAQIAIVREAIQRGIRLSNDSLMTVRRARALGLGPILAITGSSGKTTTTTLAGKMLAQSGLTVHVGGNIGTPLIDRMEAIRPGEPIVLELSSFQLELWTPALTGSDTPLAGVDVAAITNVTPNHLDRHPDMASYADAKLNLLRTLPEGATAVLNADDAVTGAIARAAGVQMADASIAAQQPPASWRLTPLVEAIGAELREKQVRIVTFGMQGDAGASDAALVSVRRQAGDGSTRSPQYISENGLAGQSAHDAEHIADNKEEDALMFNRTIFTWRDQVRLRGDHNLSNMLGAAAIAGSAGATIESMTRVAESFEGVRHRLEIVAEMHGITWINDSIATSPERAVAGLRSFDPEKQTIFLLAGGKDKKLPWETFAEETLARVTFLIGFGDAGSMIVEKVRALGEERYARLPGMAVVHRLDEAVELAARSANDNTIVLLSPGGTSYDAYRDFEARGEHFRELVAQYAPLAARSEA